MEFGTPKMQTSEELAKIQRKRILDQADLVRQGADVTAEGIVQPTKEHVKDARIMMGDHFYDKLKNSERMPLDANFPEGATLEAISSVFDNDLNEDERVNFILSFKTVEQFLEEAERRVNFDKEISKERKERALILIKKMYDFIEKNKSKK